MCDHGCHGVNDCAHDREQDTWIVSDRPASTETARPATETRQEPDPVHAPALTVDGFTEALGRDGGGDPYTRAARDELHRLLAEESAAERRSEP